MRAPFLSEWFEYETGHAWCESAYKYQTHPYVAEFANTKKMNRLLIRGIILVATGVLSALCFWEPNLNAVALMLFSVPASFVIIYEGRHCALPEVETFPKRSLTLWGIGFGCWFADRLFCDFWLWMGTPYLHALFHLLAGLAGYTVFVMFSIIDIEARAKEHRFTAAVKYFPSKSSSIFAFPYISLKERYA
ncbi:hypothetical protein WR25_04792 [Diploscapter pachys]|uniref:Alkaline ceramidase n=1 Tax=Diploscapter pachys TaxID=2018661 RepID=A0A2A2LBU7_9BILA|nr:hypothetical protein WR25_04792 [Diploscapter pachys]